MLRNTSLIVRFSLLFILALGLIATAGYLMMREVYYSELERQARNMADNVDAFGRWASQYGRIWVRDVADTRYLSQVSVPAAEGAQTSMSFYSKNPVLAQREFSEVVAKSTNVAKFRITSDNWMNPANKPDGFEAEAIAIIKNRNLAEYAEVRNGTYRYARRMVHSESCISCHGDPNTAPKEVVERYGAERGYGFKAGDVAGVISVTLPTQPLLAAAFGVLGPLEIGLVLSAFVILYLFIHIGVVRPIKRLTQNAEAISVGRPVALNANQYKPNGGNELGQLTHALARLRVSVELAIQRMRQKR